MRYTDCLKSLGLCATLGLGAFAPAASAGTPVQLYAFTGGADGGGAHGLVADAAGNLYGLTQAGTAWRLAPPTNGGNWTETTIYTFAGNPLLLSTLAMDASGNLYGTATNGGAYGDGFVFRLSPGTSGGLWTETMLYSFRGNSDGANPVAGLILDQAGNVYGTTGIGGAHSGCCGTVFRMSPPVSGSGSWTRTPLYNFTGGSDGSAPQAVLTFDKGGNLYGTTSTGGIRAQCCGTVFKLSPRDSGPWSYSLLHSFSGPDGREPLSGLVFDKAGVNLYGTMSYGAGNGQIEPQGCGIAIELSPPESGSGPWTWTKVHRFGAAPDGCQPYGGMVFDPAGNLYGTTYLKGTSQTGTLPGGIAFELSAHGISWKETITPFESPLTGSSSGASLIFDPPVGGAITLYGTCYACGPHNSGAVFAWTP